MNTPIEISSLADYINQIDEIIHSEKNYLYRGQENEVWRVTSSAYRRLLIGQIDAETGLSETHVDIETGLSEIQVDAETGFLSDLFVGYLKQIVDEVQLKYPSTYRELSALECMAHLQHNKVATGLIDFTFNPLVALWFACDSREETNGKVIVLENDSGDIEEITTKDRLQQDLDEFFDVEQAQWYIWTPTLDSLAVDTQRMTMQQSVFLFGSPEVPREMITQEIIIRSDHKGNLRTALAKMGISEKILFSDLLGFFERNTSEQLYDQTLAEPYYGGTRDGNQTDSGEQGLPELFSTR